jgi:hypothetical protein
MLYRRLWLLAAALLLLFGALACEPWPDVEWENATSHRVAVYEGGKFEFNLEPHEIQPVSTSEDDWRSWIRVVAEDGRVLLEDEITWDELREMDYRIVISEPVPASPTPPAQLEPEELLTPTPRPEACWGGSLSPLGPNPPANLRAELESNPMVKKGEVVRLQWDDNADDEQCALIERKVDEEDWYVYERFWNPQSGSPSLIDVPTETGLHCYRVLYGHSDHLSASNEACVEVEVAPVVVTATPRPVTPVPAPGRRQPGPCNLGDDPPYSELAPSPPTDLTAVVEPGARPVSPYDIGLHWQGDDSALCYIVQRLEHDGVWRQFESYMWRTTGWDIDPERGVGCYRLAAANEHGRSDWSEEACAKGPTIVLPVTPEPTSEPTPEPAPTQRRLEF